MLAGETTHSTDQPEGKAVKPANLCSKALPENKATSKAEYTNTQQGLPIIGYTLVRYLDMQGFLAGGVCFAEKQLRVSPYFHILAFIILVQLTILDKHLSLIIHVGNN